MGESTTVSLSYCATFLPQEMLHAYRQVTGLRSFESWVVTRNRTNADRFPFANLLVLRKDPLRAFTRLYRRLRGRPARLGQSEVRQALRFAARRDARLLHVYLGSEALRALPLLRRWPGARVVSFHGGDLSRDFTAEDYAELWPNTELVLCRSESLKRALAARGCPERLIRLNFTGVPIPALGRPRIPAGGDGHAPLRLLQVCRLIPKKGLDVTLQAVRQLKDDGCDVRLAIAGSGPDEASLRELAARLGLDKEVQFAGFVTGPALERLFGDSDLFLHPSRETSQGDREGIPNSMLEAMSHALPVVATRHSGIPEAVTHGEHGLLIDACEPQALAAAVRQIAGDPALRARLSAGARATVEERFSIARCVAALEDAYREALTLRSC